MLLGPFKGMARTLPAKVKHLIQAGISVLGCEGRVQVWGKSRISHSFHLWGPELEVGIWYCNWMHWYILREDSNDSDGFEVQVIVCDSLCIVGSLVCKSPKWLFPGILSQCLPFSSYYSPSCPEKLIAGILGILCLVLMSTVVTIAVIPCKYVFD